LIQIITNNNKATNRLSITKFDYNFNLLEVCHTTIKIDWFIVYQNNIMFMFLEKYNIIIMN